MSYSLDHHKFLSDAERTDLLRVLEMRKDKDSRDVTLLYTLMFTGARATEVLNIARTDLNPGKNKVLIHGVKGSRDREVPVPAWLFQRLKGVQGDSRLLFTIKYNRLREVWTEFRPVKKKLHSLRHTFALRLYMRTKDLRLVQLALGHKSINNTMVYLDYVYSDQEMERIIE